MNTIRLDPEKDESPLSRGFVECQGRGSPSASGAVKGKNGNITGFDDAQIRAFKEQNKENKNLISNVDAFTAHVARSPKNGVTKQEMDSGMYFQRDNRGAIQMYSGDGSHIPSEQEKFAREDFDHQIVTNRFAGMKNGRSAPGDLTPAARVSADRAVSSGRATCRGTERGDDRSMGR